jgi:GNAT superfamily N-acetyltransferase
MYRIRAADGQNEDVADILTELHSLVFFDAAAMPDFAQGHWWLAYRGDIPVGFAGVVASAHAPNAGYFSRVGVVRRHRGHKLQLRFLRTAEAQVRRNGWHAVVSDTTDNLFSANNFIRAGYQLYEPKFEWAWPRTLYWRKSLV